METKRCTSCDSDKNVSEFPYSYKGCKSTRKDICRKCDKKKYLHKYYIDKNLNESNKQRYSADPRVRQKTIQRTKDWRISNRDKYNESEKERRREKLINPISDTYIKYLLKNAGILSPTKEIIYLYRVKIQIQRETGVINANLNK
jgi:hypothetical protein